MKILKTTTTLEMATFIYFQIQEQSHLIKHHFIHYLGRVTIRET